jgi:hypothetical protein
MTEPQELHPVSQDIRYMNIDAPAVISELAGYAYSSTDPFTRLATVDSAYSGVGNPKVTFDGETILSSKTYQFLGAVPRAGARVIMRAMGDSWVIVGTVGGGLRTINIWSVGATAITAQTNVTPQVLCSLQIPDPGWPYRLGAMGTAYYEVVDKSAQSISNQWDLLCRRDSANGAPISRQGVGRPNSWRQVVAGPALVTTVLTGVTLTYLTLHRVDAAITDGPLLSSASSTRNGMLVFQVPA